MNAQEIAQRLARYLGWRWADQTVVVDTMQRIPGGASRETWRLVATSQGEPHRLVLRLDPVSSLIETERHIEYRTTEILFDHGFPVPRPLFLEQDLTWLERPFSLSYEIPGCLSSRETFPPDHREQIGIRKWRLLGEMAGLDPYRLGFSEFMGPVSPAMCGLEQLDHWERVLHEDQLHPDPVAAAAARWLRRNPLPPAQKIVLVHGDFRSGNFLYTSDGEITAILDWEMAHLGDPLEDLAWSFDPLWSWSRPELAGMLLPRATAIEHWEAASGLRADPEALRWWKVFAAFKGLAIWTSSSNAFHTSPRKDAILAMAGWTMTNRQQQILLDYISPLSCHRFGGGVS